MNRKTRDGFRLSLNPSYMLLCGFLVWKLAVAEGVVGDESLQESPTVRCGVSVSAPRTEESIRCVVARDPSFAANVQRAWGRILRKSLETKGRLVFAISVAPDGRAVATAKIDTIGDQEFSRLVKALLENINYGASTGSVVEVLYQMEFGS